MVLVFVCLVVSLHYCILDIRFGHIYIFHSFCALCFCAVKAREWFHVPCPSNGPSATDAPDHALLCHVLCSVCLVCCRVPCGVPWARSRRRRSALLLGSVRSLLGSLALFVSLNPFPLPSSSSFSVSFCIDLCTFLCVPRMSPAAGAGAIYRRPKWNHFLVTSA